MKKEFMTTLKYGMQYIISAIILLLLTGSFDFEYCDAVDYVIMIVIFLAPLALMLVVNLIRVHHDEKLIEKIRKEVEAE